MELKGKNTKKVWRSILAAMLTLCLGLGCLGVPVSANTANNSAGEGTSKTTKSAEVKVFDNETVQLEDIESNALDIGSAVDVNLTTESDVQWFAFTPDKDGKYIVYSDRIVDGNNTYADTYGALYEPDDENEGYIKMIASNDDGGDENHFNIVVDLNAETTYYLCVSTYDYSASFQVHVKEFVLIVPKSFSCNTEAKYSSIENWRSIYESWNGDLTFTIGYEDENVAPKTKSIDYDYMDEFPFNLYDVYDNYINISFVGSEAQEQAFYSGNSGKYTLKATLYDYSDKEIKSQDITYTICGYEETGGPLKTMEYDIEYPIAANGRVVFKIIPKESGVHVFTDRTNTCYVRALRKKGEESKNIITGDGPEWYAKLVKGEVYYLLVGQDSDGGPSGAMKCECPGYKPPQPAPVVVNSGIPAQKVSVAKTKLSLQKGKSITLSTLLTPLNSTDQLTYSSSNSKVVQVNANGKVTAKKPGKAKVTITTSSGKSVIVTITVKKKASATTKLSVKKKITVKVGTVQFLPYKINASSTDKITWKSSKKSVVTVDSNGKITAKKKGKATITIKAGKKKATCTVTVK